jgi:hypothetical protein
MTAGSAAQPEVLQASNIKDDRHIGNLAADKSCDPTSRDVGAEDAMPRASALNAHLEEMET